MCHGNGYGAINLETEEDIRKWREERRKNFPTKARIAEKNALAEGSAKRGEQIKTKKFDMKEKRRSSYSFLSLFSDVRFSTIKFLEFQKNLKG